MNNDTSNNTQNATKYTKVGFNNTPTKTKKSNSEILNSSETPSNKRFHLSNSVKSENSNSSNNANSSNLN